MERCFWLLIEGIKIGLRFGLTGLTGLTGQEKIEPQRQFEDFDFVLMLRISLGEPSVLHTVRIEGRKKGHLW